MPFGVIDLFQVRFIRHGLSVQSPHHKASHAKVKQKLYSAYHLATTRSQLASLSFRDGSILHMNQNTDLTLRTSHVTNVKQGEVDVIDNGGHHQVVTAVATLSAIGTQYDVRVIVGKGGKVTMIVTVVSGQVMVTTSQGTQQVNAGDQVMVSSSGTISQPVPVDAASVVTWTSVLPAPPASSSPTPTPTASATAAAATPTPTATSLPTPTATPTSIPATLFSYSFGGLTANFMQNGILPGTVSLTVTKATGCGSTGVAGFRIMETWGDLVANPSYTITKVWMFANTLKIFQVGGIAAGGDEVDFFLTMHGADTSAPTVTMAAQFQGSLWNNYTPGTVSVPVTKTPVTSCP